MRILISILTAIVIVVASTGCESPTDANVKELTFTVPGSDTVYVETGISNVVLYSISIFVIEEDGGYWQFYPYYTINGSVISFEGSPDDNYLVVLN